MLMIRFQIPGVFEQNVDFATGKHRMQNNQYFS